MDLDSIVSVSITRDSTQPTRQGFGTPLLAGYFPSTVFPERVRTYSQADDLLDDGFVATDPIYRMAVDLKSQTNAPPTFKVGRRALAYSQTVDFTPTDTTEGAVYTLTVAIRCRYRRPAANRPV